MSRPHVGWTTLSKLQTSDLAHHEYHITPHQTKGVGYQDVSAQVAAVCTNLRWERQP